MKKIKVLVLSITLVFGLCLMAGCAKVDEQQKDQNNAQEEKSVAVILRDQFKEEIKNEKDLEKVAKTISENKKIATSTDVSTLKKSDYLSGFKTEIKGYKKAIAIRPIIGTIPFIAYIFEVENPSDFAKNLEENADLRWNVCTEADDLEIAIVDNYVFFVMAPRSFEEE